MSEEGNKAYIDTRRPSRGRDGF